MFLPEPNPISDSAEERLWNHIADRKQGGDPVGAAFCAAHPATDAELRDLLSLADTVQDTLRRDVVALDHAQIARERLATTIAEEPFAASPAPGPRSAPFARLFGRRLYPAYAVALLMLLAALAGGATALSIMQHNAAADNAGALCPTESHYFERIYHRAAPKSKASPVAVPRTFNPASKAPPPTTATPSHCD